MAETRERLVQIQVELRACKVPITLKGALEDLPAADEPVEEPLAFNHSSMRARRLVKSFLGD